ncbi:MAG: hypothetical protein ABIQ93_04945 [Saprospiraceae bacterium]
MQHKIQICLFAFLLYTFTVAAQRAVDPKWLKQAETALAIEMPTAETQWLAERAYIGEVEMGFRRDTFRIRYTLCFLNNSLFEEQDSMEMEESKIDRYAANLDWAASEYDRLITKYLGLTESYYPLYINKASLKKLWKSQKAWINYRDPFLALYNSGSGFSIVSELRRKINKERLLELYDFYEELSCVD